MATTVVHLHHAPPGAVYIGRRMPQQGLDGSPFANPFRIGPDGTREEVIAKYERWLTQQPDLMARLPQLRGKTLACWCAPQACHGHVLARLADQAPMRALSLWQPWAILIAIGAKRIETRSWATPYRGPIAIHASKTCEWPSYDPDGWGRDAATRCLQVLAEHGCRYEADLPSGAIVATARLVGCFRITHSATYRLIDGQRYFDVEVNEPERSFGDYTPGRFGWVLDDVQALNPPEPARGNQGIWEWRPAGVAA